ncbi:hypothetical protein [Flavitalea sp.]|nr:hypothetical protein [Flavitalea sp.]
MVEVFKTTVCDSYYAKLLLRKIHARFPVYQANFDLSDCDHILRIKSPGSIDVYHVLLIIRSFGYQAEVLPDEVVLRT